MLRKELNGVVFLEFSLLQEFTRLQHAVFTKHGGVSEGSYASLNAAFNTGDLDENVQENRRRIQNVFTQQDKAPHLFSLTQVHSDIVVAVDEPLSTYETPPSGDGLLCAIPHRALLIKHADCQAAIFYDPVHHACANVHAGWRGNVQNIYKKTIGLMKQKYGSKPEDLFVCISPSLGPQASEFSNYENELPKEFLPFQVAPTYFDLWEISKWQLMQENVLAHHIEIAQICSRSTPDDFFSYRREKASGRNATVVALLP